jgi:hypothetical protein
MTGSRLYDARIQSHMPSALRFRVMLEQLLLCCLQEQAAAVFTMELGTAECRQQLFALDEQFPHYLNHGSYGATFRCCSRQLTSLYAVCIVQQQ